MRAESLTALIAGPVFFSAGYLSFQIHDPYDDDSPVRYGTSAAAMGLGIGGIGDGIGTIIARRGLKNALDSGKPAAIASAREKARKQQGIADVASGGLMAALSLPFFVWSPILAEEDSAAAANDALGTGAGLFVGGGAFVGLGLSRLLVPEEMDDLAAIPSVWMTTMPGSTPSGIPTLGMTSSW